MSSTSGKTYFITGGNRGIGFSIVKQLAQNPNNTIIATARDPTSAQELQALSKSNQSVHIVKLDVSSSESIAELDSQLSQIAKDGIDTFISNAAIADAYTTILDTEKSTFLNHYTTNVIGPIEITKILYPYLAKKETKQLIYTSSLVGSLSGFFPVSTSAYGQSKAALNHTVLSLSNELKDLGFTVVAVHPGAVKSDMGSYGVDLLYKKSPDVAKYLVDNFITVEQSANDQITKVYQKLTKESNGKFYNYDGSGAAW